MYASAQKSRRPAPKVTHQPPRRIPINATVACDDVVNLLEQRVMKVCQVGYDAAARQLRLLSDQRALEEREQMVLRAGQAAQGLRGMAHSYWR